MISELERYQGVVFRQLIVAHPEGAYIKAVNLSGRADAFAFGGTAFQIKHSAKRLSPWRFSYSPENVAELDELSRRHESTWVFLCCGPDGVVGLELSEMTALVGQLEGAQTQWISVHRSRSTMYRVAGSRGELAKAKVRGVQPFVDALRVRSPRLGP